MAKSKKWKEIEETGMMYAVSEDGEIKRLCNNRIRQSKTGRLNLRDKAYYIPKLVYRYFVGKIKDGGWIRFKDGNRSNWHYSNLLYITPEEVRQINIANLKAANAVGSNHKGGRRKKLNKEQILQIKESIGFGVKITVLARQYGVNRETIKNYLKE